MNLKISVPAGYKVDDYLDGNIDVNVVVDDRDVYFATLFTIRNIEKLLSEQFLAKHYFWSTDMIIVENLEVKTIKKAIENLVNDGILESACTYIGRVEDLFVRYPLIRNLI